ncbi:hypothetical protein MUG91_G69n123 [Manis pentadactyla]|nr:hypothetical protein MUG91_G69n123 [Manis pentadactyla]
MSYCVHRLIVKAVEEKASQCLTLLQPCLVPLTDTRESRKETKPPAPMLGYSITTKDCDREKQVMLQWLNRVLEDKTETASNSDSVNPPATPPSSNLTLPAAGTAASSASLPALSTNLLLGSLKKKLNPLGLPSFPESSGVAATTAYLPLKTPGFLGPLGSSQPGPLPGPSQTSAPQPLSQG